jgi:hypothetical protein
MSVNVLLMRYLVVALSVVFLLAGCSSAPEENDADAPTEYGTIEELRDAAVDAGLDCDDWEEGTADGNWAQYGTCGSDTTLATYTSESQRDDDVDGAKERALGGELLVGPNWTVRADDVADLQTELGGTVVTLG